MKDNDSHPCQACDQERMPRGGSPSRHASSLGRDGEEEEAVMTEGPQTAACHHKHVGFAPLVEAVYIPVHSEYR